MTEFRKAGNSRLTIKIAVIEGFCPNGMLPEAAMSGISFDISQHVERANQF